MLNMFQMNSGISYCPMTGTSCLYDLQEIRPNSFFLIQPFDNDKIEREKAVEFALRKFYGKGRYQLKKSDSRVHLQANYCDICLKIRSCQFCIADLSGEIFKVLIEGEMKEKAFLRPNISFELGLAYGFSKPSFILFKKLTKFHKLPSDLDFIRYVDIKAEKWSMVAQKLLDMLRNNAPSRAIISNADEAVVDIERIKKDINSIIHQKENLQQIEYKNYKINQILLRNNRLIGIIKNTNALREGTYFNLYVTENYIEEKKALVRIESINEEKRIAQIKIDVTDCRDYWAAIAKDCCEKDYHVLGEHRLEVFISKEFKELNIDELKIFSSLLDKCW
jgi:hypothetical protein